MSDPGVPRGRAYVIGLCVSFPELRTAIPSEGDLDRIEGAGEGLHPDDIALLSSITDDEVAAVRTAVEGQFTDVYPAGI